MCSEIVGWESADLEISFVFSKACGSEVSTEKMKGLLGGAWTEGRVMGVKNWG